MKRITALLLAFLMSISGLGSIALAADVDASDNPAAMESVETDQTLSEEPEPPDEQDSPAPATVEESEELPADGSEEEEPTEEEEPQVSFPVEQLTYSAGSTVIRPQMVEEQLYLFLPASADLSTFCLDCGLTDNQALWISGDRNETGIPVGEGVDLTAVATETEGYYPVTLTIVESAAEPDGQDQTVASTQLRVMHSANLPALYLTSSDPAEQGRTYVDASRDNEATGSMALQTAERTFVYDGQLTQIKARGNSTFKYYPKKSYQIKLKDKTALVDGTKKGKTWVLLGAYTDGTKMVDQIWKEAAVCIGEPYAAKENLVDLYYDGEYRGTYMLSEKNQINGNRIDITDMEEAYAELNPGYGENMTAKSARNRFSNKYTYIPGLQDPDQYGGFLLEFNGSSGDEVCWFKMSSGLAFNVKAPEFASTAVMRHISEYMQEFENAVMATDAEGNYTGRNPDTGLYYYDYCDLESLVQIYLLNSVASNSDGFWRSLYFYMDTDGKLYAGPIWDMELTSGTGWTDSIPAEQDWMAGTVWGSALSQIPSFRAALKAYYEEHFVDIQDALLGDAGACERTGLRSIQERADWVRASEQMDHILWPIYLKNGSPFAEYPNKSLQEYINAGRVDKYTLWPEGTSFDDLVRTRVEWTQAHKSFLDSYFANLSEGHAHVYGAAVDNGDGTHTRTCRDCGEPVTESCNYQVTETALSATQAGQIQGVCSVCGNSYTQTVTLDKGKTFTSGSLIYQVSAKDKTVTVQQGTKKTLTSVSVPGTVSYGGVTYKVTAIGKAAFQNYTALKSVSVGKYVTSIGASAFYGCTKLTQVTNAAAVTTIGEKAFCNDGVLASVSSLKSCTTIGNYAFYKCYKLKKLTDTEKVTSVGKGAFQYDKALVSLSSLKNCKTIGGYAFYKCTSLTRIGSTQNRISLYAVTTIGEKAFAYCTSMTNFYDASANLKTIGASCFYGDGKLKTITLKSTVLTSKSVGANAFKGIYAKAKIKVPAAKLKQYQSYLKGKGQGSKVQIVKY